MSNDNPTIHAIKVLASKVLFALSVNFFNSVFSRISSKLQELASCPDENPDYSDIELIQHINVDQTRLTRLLTGKNTNFIQIKLIIIIKMFCIRSDTKVSPSEKVRASCTDEFSGESNLELDGHVPIRVCRITEKPQ